MPMKFKVKIALRKHPERTDVRFWIAKNKIDMIERFEKNPDLMLLEIIERVF